LYRRCTEDRCKDRYRQDLNAYHDSDRESDLLLFIIFEVDMDIYISSKYLFCSHISIKYYLKYLDNYFIRNYFCSQPNFLWTMIYIMSYLGLLFRVWSKYYIVNVFSLIDLVLITFCLVISQLKEKVKNFFLFFHFREYHNISSHIFFFNWYVKVSKFSCSKFKYLII